MTSDRVFSGSVPAIYDVYLVPLIFEACAEDLAGRVAARRRRECWRRPPARAL